MALRWDGADTAAECLHAERLVESVESYLGRPAFDPASPRTLSVRVEPTPDARRRALVAGVDADGRVLGEREIFAESSECDALEDPLVLAIALLVDSDLGLAPEQKPEAPPPPPEPEAPPEEVEEDEEEELIEAQPVKPVEPPRPPDPWRLDVDGSVVGADGLLPSFGFGVELGVTVDPPWSWPLRVRAAGWLPQSEQPTTQSSIDFRLGLAGLVLCPISERSGGIQIQACAGADIVAQQAESHGLDQARATTPGFAQGSLALRVILELPSPAYAVVSTGVGIPVRAPEFVVKSDGETLPVFQTAEGTLVAGIGIGVRALE